MSPLTTKICFFAFLVFAVATGSTRAQDSSSSEEALNLKNELKACAMKVINDPKEIAKLRPTYGECLQITSNQSNAIRLWHYAVGFYDFVSSEGGLPVEENPDGVTVEILTENSDGLKECRKKLAEEFQSGHAWYMVTFKKGEKQVGIFSGFARINNRWILVPRFYQAFSKEKTPPLHATVLKMLSEDMPDDLYDLCSPRITEQLKRNDASTFFDKLGVSKIRDLDVKTRGSKRVNDFTQIHYGMNIEFEDGRSAAVNMIFDRTDKKGFGLAWIALQSRLGVDAPSLFAPLPTRCRELAKNLYVEILTAFEKRDFQKLHDESAVSIQKTMTVEQLEDAFPLQNEVLSKLPLLDPETITLSSPPSLGRRDEFTASNLTFRPENERVPEGPLIIKALFSTQDGKQSVAASFEFVFEDEKWKPSAYTFQLPPKDENE